MSKPLFVTSTPPGFCAISLEHRDLVHLARSLSERGAVCGAGAGLFHDRYPETSPEPLRACRKCFSIAAKEARP